MAWTGSSRTWSAGDAVTAAILNSDVRDPINSIGSATSYTPTLTGITVGDGTLSAYTAQTGPYWFGIWVKFTLGTTSAITGNIGISLPVAPSSFAANAQPHVEFRDYDTGNTYTGACYITPGSATVYLRSLGTNGLHQVCGASSPFTWAASDVITVGGWFL